MKLLRAKFQNFRLLRDLELEFSTDDTKKLTVIRAANESGKTTILHALQWALYGEEALPDKGEGFRLHPIDWDASEGRSAQITATIEFEVSTHRTVDGEVLESCHQYRLERSSVEDVDGPARRSVSQVTLFELNDGGATRIESPGTLVSAELPPELREVFFTDGDRALSFIQASVALSTKRERVQRAIRSLLGLGIIDDAIKHVRKSTAEANKKAKQLGVGTELHEIASRIGEIEQEHEQFADELQDAKQQFEVFDQKVYETDDKISAALQKGDKEELRKNLDVANSEIKRIQGCRVRETRNPHN